LPAERGLHHDRLERQILRHLVGHEHRDLVHELFEIARGGRLVAQDRQLVLDQRVIEHREVGELGVWHGREGISRVTRLPNRAGTNSANTPRHSGRRVWRDLSD